MKKFILWVMLTLVLGSISTTNSFAATQEIRINCDVNGSLTKKIIISAPASFTINWGDGKTENVEAGTNIEKTHTYSGISARQITITGTAIEGVKATFNEITNIDLSKISTLTSLDVSNNKISNLSTLSGNTGLIELRCRNNYLTNVNVGSLNNLKILDCSNNSLTSFGVPTTIKELYLEGTGLNVLNNNSSFDVASYNLLEVLDCSKNNVINLNVSQNSNLKKLYCSENKITALNLTSNSKLEKLNCSNNNINSLRLNSGLKEAVVTSNSELISLTVGNLDLLVVDNSVSLSGSASTLIKVNVTGNGMITANNEIIYMFPKLNCEVTSIKLNGVGQTITNGSVDISNYIGTNLLEIGFTSEEELILAETMNKPELLQGMIPVKHNGENWVITNKEDPEWYNYSKSDMKWANVMLRDNAKYLGYDGVTLVSITDNTPLKDMIGREVPESSTGSMYVWIPRFTYKIGESTINIKYSSGLFDDITDGYLVHPAFNYANYLGNEAGERNNYKNGLTDNDKLEGLWIAKYPAKGNVTAPKYYAGGTEIKNETIGNAFLASKKTSPVDGNSHMIKNTEWGAVSYFATAVGSLENNSTTGNIYGIYGMNSGAEYVSHYIELIGGISNYSVRKNGISLIPYSINNFNHTESNIANIKDIDVLKLINPEDNSQNNYQTLSEFYGIGINEVKSNITGGILGSIPSGKNAFFLRGIDGIYSYDGTDGGTNSNAGFRNVILPTLYERVEDEESYYVISSSEGNGILSPLGKTTVLKGDNITFSMIPNTGYEILDVKLDNVSVLRDVSNYNSYSTYTISGINANHTLYVEFAQEIGSYNVSVNVNPVGSGSVSGVGTYNSRSKVELTAIPSYGYKFKDWEVVSGISSIDPYNNPASFSMPDNNVVLKANFEIGQFKLTIIQPSGTTTQYKKAGDAVLVQAETVVNNDFAGWTEEGLSGIAESAFRNQTLSFDMPSNDVIVKSNYHQEEYTISYDPNGGEGEFDSQIKSKYVNLVLTNRTPTKEHHDFLGWAETYDATEAEYQPSGIFTKDENTTLYAVWKEKERKLAIETNESIIYGNEFCGTSVIVSAEVVNGFVFKSWTSAGITLTRPNIVIEMPEEEVTVRLNYLAQ